MLVTAKYAESEIHNPSVKDILYKKKCSDLVLRFNEGEQVILSDEIIYSIVK